MTFRFAVAALAIFSPVLEHQSVAEQLKKVEAGDIKGSKLYAPADPVLTKDGSGKAERYVLIPKGASMTAKGEAKDISSSLEPFELEIGSKSGMPVYAQVYGDAEANKKPSEALAGTLSDLQTYLQQSGSVVMQKCDGSWICVRKDKERCLQWRCVGVRLNKVP